MKNRKEHKELTIKQMKFCNEFLICGNQTEAALKAGYAKSTADKQAQLWVGKNRETSRYPMMYDYIQKKRKDLENEYAVTKGAVLKGMHRIASVDPRKIFDEDGNAIPIHLLDDDTIGAIAGIEVVEMKSEGGVATFVKKIKLADRNSAWANIAKMLGYNAAEKVQHEAGESFLELLKETSVKKSVGKR